MDKKEQADRILRLVNAWAMEVLSYPVEEREAAFQRIKESNLCGGDSIGATSEEAQEWADKMDYFTRGLVGIIEKGGGAGGGTA